MCALQDICSARYILLDFRRALWYCPVLERGNVKWRRKNKMMQSAEKESPQLERVLWLRTVAMWRWNDAHLGRIIGRQHPTRGKNLQTKQSVQSGDKRTDRMRRKTGCCPVQRTEVTSQWLPGCPARTHGHPRLRNLHPGFSNRGQDHAGCADRRWSERTVALTRWVAIYKEKAGNDFGRAEWTTPKFLDNHSQLVYSLDKNRSGALRKGDVAVGVYHSFKENDWSRHPNVCSPEEWNRRDDGSIPLVLIPMKKSVAKE